MCDLCSSRHSFKRLPAPDPQRDPNWAQSVRDGLWIFSRDWLVPFGHSTPLRGLVFIVHGYGEHCERYTPIARWFNSIGFHVFSHDHIGHGRSQGTRAHVQDFQDYVADYLNLMKRVQQKYSQMPVFLFAHSMGGLIGLHVVRSLLQDSAGSPFLRQLWPLTGVILSAPALKPDPKQDNAFMRGLARCCSSCMPKFGIDKLPSSGLSRVAAVGEQFDEDPLNYHGNIRAQLGFELLKAMEIIHQNAAQLDFPYLLIQGTSDRLVNPAGAREFHAISGCKDKTFKEYEGGYHELFVDTIADQVLADIQSWMESKLQGSNQSPASAPSQSETTETRTLSEAESKSEQ